jgi:hypothetical protein
MPPVQLLRDGAAPGEARDVRGTERKRLYEPPEAMGVIRHPEIDGQIRGAPRAGLVPCDDGEFVR